MENRNSKQIIVMRKSFIDADGKKVTPRKGKYIAQGAHASLKAILDEGLFDYNLTIPLSDYDGKYDALHDWITGSFTKICCCVETEEELLNVYNKAEEKGLLCALIKDKGLTEFGGVETITCCAIGPAWEKELIGITDKLELF